VKESPPDVKERRLPSGKPPEPKLEPSRLTSPGGVLPPRFELIEVGLDGILHDVNNAFDGVGQVVTSAGELRAVLLTSGGLNDLGTLGGSASSARGINEAGAIVGGSLTEGDVEHHAFLYEDGAMHDLNTLVDAALGYELIQALGINDRGDIMAIASRQGADCMVLLKRRDRP
jgi:probable HAF family extracellular repeat protein